MCESHGSRVEFDMFIDVYFPLSASQRILLSDMCIHSGWWLEVTQLVQGLRVANRSYRTLLIYGGVFTFLVDAYPLYAASALAANLFARCSFAGM